MRRSLQLTPVFFLLPLLLLISGFVADTQMSSDEARRVASFVPELDELVSRPTIKTSADYDTVSDSWRVVLTEETSRTEVAELMVEDDTQEVSGVEVYPVAGTLTYPETSEAQAIKLAAADSEVREEFGRHGPHTSEAEYENGRWIVHFKVDQSEENSQVGGRLVDDGKRKEIARVSVDDETWRLRYVWTGDQVRSAMARGDYDQYGRQANYWYVWAPLALIFALAFLRTDKIYSLRNLDIAVLLSFLVSHGFFRAGESYWAVLLWYPPLLYLIGRTLLVGFGYGERVEKTSNFPPPVLFLLGALASSLILGLNVYSRVFDVGYSGVLGADLITNGTLPYGNMPDNESNGDTYGPLNYLLYIPFVRIFGWSGERDYLLAAHVVAVLAFVIVAVAMFIVGQRYAGVQGGAALFFAWTAFPYTLYSTNLNTNDLIVAAIMAVGIAMLGSPLARGASVAAGFAVKLFPLILVPLWMLHDGPRRFPILRFVLGGVSVVLLTFWVLTLDGDPIGGVRIFYERTLGYQGNRETPWTIFTQVPELDFLREPLIMLVILLALLVAVLPKKRTIRRLAAFSAALVIAFELTLNYWFYTYITWFVPLVFLTLLLATSNKTALDEESDQPPPVGNQTGKQP
jgi:hypothetical protein